MVRHFLIGVAILLSTTVCAQSPTPDKLSDQAKSARDFAFEKVKLGTTQEEFLKRYSNALLVLNDEKVKAKAYQIDVLSASGCAYYFSDGKLYQIRVLYEADAIENLGGMSVLAGKLVEKFGKTKPGDTKVKRDENKLDAVWRFPEVDRVIELTVNGDFARLDVTDTKLFQELTERKKKAAKTGFDD